MRRGIWIGAAIVIAAAAAVPLWLVVDDDGVRRLGAIDPTTVQGDAGRMTLAGVNGGVPIAIDNFSLQVRRAVGAAQPEVDSIEVTLPVGENMPPLVSRAVQGTKPASGKVELVSIGDAPTVYLAFDLTNVTVDSVEDSYSTMGAGARGTEKVVLRYDAMTMTCAPVACAQPTHTPGTVSELAVPEVGANAVRLESGRFTVPKGFKSASAFPTTVAMELSYLVPALLSRARDGKALEKTTQIDLVRLFNENPRKIATYKLPAAVVTSFALGGGLDVPLVHVEFSSRRLGVTAYSFLANGAPDKSSTFCWDMDKNAASCAGF